ncbi:hypothetical protein F7725_022289 [Dissostichus mawsoni]|uniref:Olfactomedin-like domain-containing protein n=1 Tax=Dissostichus mawsoni TaxID=36200 RepID=A0A7J5YXA5_DISMA|nr:hypothetical protein F7725_022289 [Dissostichus mawsoni]
MDSQQILKFREMIKGEETVKHLKDLRTRAKVALGRKVNSVTKMVNTMLEEELMKEYGEVHKAGTKVTEANSEYLMKLILNADSDEDQVSEELRADVEKTDGETSQRLEEVSEVIKANLWSRHGERKVMFAVGEAEKVYEEAEATQIDLVSYESYEKQLNNLEILIKELKEVHSTWRGWAPATAKTDVEEIVRQLETRKNALKRQKEAEFNKARGAAELARTAAEDERAQFALVQLRQDQAQRSKLAEAQIAAEEARMSLSLHHELSLCLHHLYVIVPLWALLALTQQAPSDDKCACELTNSEKAFPHDKLSGVKENVSKCNSNVIAQKVQPWSWRVCCWVWIASAPAAEDVSLLEKEDDGELYGVISLQVIENEMREIQQLMERLNSTTLQHQRLTAATAEQSKQILPCVLCPKLEDLRAEMQDLETYDTSQVIKTQQANQRLKKDLDQCQNGQPTPPPLTHHPFVNITGPRVHTAGEFPDAYKYGAWGRDPKPEAGKESWHWLVMLTVGNKFSNYVRLYSSLSSLIVGLGQRGGVKEVEKVFTMSLSLHHVFTMSLSLHHEPESSSCLPHDPEAPSDDKCACELTNSEKAFPHDKLSGVKENVSKCNSNVIAQKTMELESLLLGLDRRLPQLLEDVSLLEKEDDGELYGVISLQVIENEMREIQQLMERLNSTTLQHQRLTAATAEQLEDLRAEMQDLETYDTSQVIKTQQANQRLKKDLDQCQNGQPTPPPTHPPPGNCPHGQFVNITGPRVHTAGEFPDAYKYGAWGRDPKPEAGKESWHWLVMLTVGNKFSNYVRNVQISPLTDHQHYPGFNSKGNFCHLDECYLFTDLDLATDESGVWVEEGEPLRLGQTWHTSVYKQGVTNTFMACGVLYATRYSTNSRGDLFSFDTTTGEQKFNLGIFIKKMSPNIHALNYSPVDQMLHAYCDAFMVSYKVLFEEMY